MGLSLKNFKDKDILVITDRDDYRWVFVYAENANKNLATNYGCICYPTDDEDSFYFSISTSGHSCVMDWEEIRAIDYATEDDCKNFLQTIEERESIYNKYADHINMLKTSITEYLNRNNAIKSNGGKTYWSIELDENKFVVKSHMFIGSKTDHERIDLGNVYIEKDCADADAEKLNTMLNNNRDIFKRTWNL